MPAPRFWTRYTISVPPETPKNHGPSFEERWRRRFEKFAEKSDDDAGIGGWSPTGLQVRLRTFARLWSGQPSGGLWLDAGCGAGTYCRFLRERGAPVVGIDYSLPSLLKAARRDQFGIPWVNADVTRLPVKPGSFDGVLCLGVMQALADSRPAVSELCGAVRPGGYIFVDALNALCIPHVWERAWRRLRKVPMHVRYEKPHRLSQLMRENGMTDIRCHWVPIMPGRLQRLQGLVETPFSQWILRWVPLAGRCLSHAFWVTARRA